MNENTETYRCEESQYRLRVDPANLSDSLLNFHRSMREKYTPGKDGLMHNGFYVCEPIGIGDAESRCNLDYWLDRKSKDVLGDNVNSDSPLLGKTIYISLPYQGPLSLDREVGKLVVSKDGGVVDVNIFGRNSFLFDPQEILDRINKLY